MKKLLDRIRRVRVTPGRALVAGVIVLVAGVAIGANTDVWNTTLRYAGLKPNVPSIDLSSLQSTYETLAAHYDGKLDTGKLVDGANHGLVSAAGNAYTVYFNKSEADSFNSDLDGSFSGIGAQLAIKDSAVTVQSVLDGSPAKAAGLQTGDTIVKVDGADATGWSVEKAATTIQGNAGTKVTLTVGRGDTTKDYTITRAALTNPSVKSEVDGNVGVMTISRFGDDTADLARSAAATFKAKNVKGVILDLRGNGGGYVDAAQSIAGLWLDNKLVVSERTDGKQTDALYSARDPLLNGIPTIVLIDGGSASASEIVAGALRDDGAATLYGQKSFGKGSYQDVFNLPGGNEIKVTVGRWYTPKGANIDGQGITPGTVITPTDAQIQAGADPVRDAALAKLNG